MWEVSKCNGTRGKRGKPPGLVRKRKPRDVEALCRARLGSLDGPAAWSQAE